MGLVLTKAAVALGLDEVMRWVMGLVAGLLVMCLMIVLIVGGTFATILGGTQARSAPAAESPSVVGTVVASASGPRGGRSADSPVGDRITELARGWLGVPYVFGGCSPTGVDCSCLVQNVYAAAGIALPRVAVDQFNATVPVGDPLPGDLVFFANTYEPGISHVGIYIGDGLQINAPTTGQVVSVAPVFTGYWGNHYAGARRARV
jgi:cell wall-associated NlpC family hydrolase